MMHIAKMPMLYIIAETRQQKSQNYECTFVMESDFSIDRVSNARERMDGWMDGQMDKQVSFKNEVVDRVRNQTL